MIEQASRALGVRWWAGGSLWLGVMGFLVVVAVRESVALSDMASRSMVSFIAHTPVLCVVVAMSHRRMDGLALLGGLCIGASIDPTFHFLALPLLKATMLASLGAGLMRWESSSWRVTVSLLCLGAFALVLAHGALSDLFEAATPRDLSECGPTTWLRTGFELAALVASASFLRGETRGLLAFAMLASAWLLHGALIATPEAFCGCTGCSGHPFSLGLWGVSLGLASIAVAPWVGPVLTHLRPARVLVSGVPEGSARTAGTAGASRTVLLRLAR